MQLRCFAWCCGPVRTLCFALPNSPERRYHCLNSIIDKGQVMAKPASVLSESQSADAMLQKHGADAATSCVTIARAGTGKRKVLVARGSYHGALPWCSPSVAGVTAEDRAHLLHFEYNDVASLRAAVDAARGDLAAILVI